MSHDHAQGVERLHLALARAVADGVHLKNRHAPKLLAQRRGDGRARGRAQLPAARAHEPGLAAQDLRNRRRRHGEEPVRALHIPRSHVDAGAEDAVRLELVDQDRRADHVHNGVDGADLVEVHLVHGRAVHLGLRLGQRAEDAPRRLLDRLLQGAAVDHRQHVVQAAVHVLVAVVVLVVMIVTVVVAVLVVVVMTVVVAVLVVMVVVMAVVVLVVAVHVVRRDVHVRAHHAVFEGLVDVQMEGVAQAELGQVPLQGLGVAARVEQRAHGHVSTDAGEAVQIENFHVCFPRYPDFYTFPGTKPV